MAKILKPTIKIVLLKHKTLSNGEHPAALRVTFNRKSKYYVLKAEQKTITCTLEKWNEGLGRFNRNKELNTFLNQYELKALEVVRELERSDFTH